MQHNRPFVRAYINIVSIGVHNQIGEDKRRLGDVVRFVDFVDRFRHLRQTTRAGVNEEHLPIWSLSAFAKDGL